MLDTSKSLIQVLADPKGILKGVEVIVKRDDLIDPVVSGNKWRKLKYNIREAERRKNERILTFGGAYSNHLIATAKAAAMAGIRCIGIVRGEELDEFSNPTLRSCADFGMQLVFISRDEYRMRNDKMYLEQLHEAYENTFIIPEGGANYFGMIGCQEIWKEIQGMSFSRTYVAGGTGTTAAGLLSALPEGNHLHVVSALKGDFMPGEIRNHLHYAFFDEELTADLMKNCTIYDDSVWGGYGKLDDRLTGFMDFVMKEFDLPLDKVYTAKAFFRLLQHIEEGAIQPGEKVLFIHTGGLQGN